jgi:lipopolysaccharide transport system ATP-binding protein
VANDVVIKVDNLSKKYVLRHERQERYTALRDVIANKFKSFGSKIFSPFTLHASRFTASEEEFWALKDINFEIKQGDRVGIIGRNGAGKSTLLKILSRITEPTSGRIEITGRVASLLEVGTGFHPELTGRENIFLNGAILGMTRAEIKKKFDEIVDFAEIEKFLDTPVKRYSSGMYVRLAFAVAAHLEPEILIVDEVLAVGDAQFQKKCLGKMEEVGKEGRTVLFVSHNMAAVSKLCESGMLLENGRLKKGGEIESCVETYMNLMDEKVGTLLEHQQRESGSINITKIVVNGINTDVLHLTRTDEPLEVEITMSVSKKCRLSLYGFLKGGYGQAIGIYSPGHMDDAVYWVKPGTHKLTATINLPKLTKGNYALELGLADPGIVIFVHFPPGLKLIVDGQPSKTGLVFEENHRNGFLVLNGSVTVESLYSSERN